MDIVIAEKDDIQAIMNVLEERCNWFKEKGLNQWTNNYLVRYNKDYFNEIMKIHQLYVVKQNNEIVGVFLLKDEDKTYWNDDCSAYYIHHLAIRVGFKGNGSKILNFIEKLAKKNLKKYIRLDCKKNNEKLNQYYQKQGFIYKGSREKPYSHNLWEKEIM